MEPQVSICIACYDKPRHLRWTLQSLANQCVDFSYEVIVVDDGSPTNAVEQVCRLWPHVRYHRIDRPPGWRNPAPARNTAYRAATGSIIIAQSDDTAYGTPATLQNLVRQLSPGTFTLATVINVDSEGRPTSNPTGKGYGDQLSVYVSPQYRRPLFFLGALYRKDLYAVGGNDEDFRGPGSEDRWFAVCLMHGLGLKPVYLPPNVALGLHLEHPHTTDWEGIAVSRRIYAAKMLAGRWVATGGPWAYKNSGVNDSRNLS